jgi:hypothetical protein
MSTSITVHSSTLRFAYRSLYPEGQSIYPRVRIDIEINHVISPGASAYNLAISDVDLDLKFRTREKGDIYLGRAIPIQPFIVLSPNSTTILTSYINLDHYGLSQIEKLREGKDLTVLVEGRLVTEIQQQSQTRTFAAFNFEFRIPKSDWVETILPQLKYKDVALLEIPKLLDPELSDVVNYVNGAWRQYSMGEYDKVLSECRKALESLNNKARGKGFEKEITDEKGAKKSVTNWGKLLGNEELGDIIGVMNQKVWGFVTPGAHAGISINRQDAEFALMTTYAIINMIASKLIS